MCLRNLQKNLVHGALIEAEILTSPSPMYLLNLAQFWVLGLCPQLGQHLPSGLKYSYVSQEPPNKIWCMGSKEAEILTPLCISSTWPSILGASTLPTGVSTPPKWPGDVSMCLRNLQKNLVHGALIETEILTSPLPHVFAQLGQCLGTGTLPMGVSTPPKWSGNVPMCLTNLQTKFGAWGPNKS